MIRYDIRYSIKYTRPFRPVTASDSLQSNVESPRRVINRSVKDISDDVFNNLLSILGEETKHDNLEELFKSLNSPIHLVTNRLDGFDDHLKP